MSFKAAVILGIKHCNYPFIITFIVVETSGKQVSFWYPLCYSSYKQLLHHQSFFLIPFSKLIRKKNSLGCHGETTKHKNLTY